MKKLCLIIFVSVFSMLAITLITFGVLGQKERIGFIEFLDNRSIENTVLEYRIRIRYYNKVFRNSDIYGVYPKDDNLPSYVAGIKWDDKGSPFGILTAKERITNFENIENIFYSLKIKPAMCLYLILFAMLYPAIILIKLLLHKMEILPFKIILLDSKNKIESLSYVNAKQTKNSNVIFICLVVFSAIFLASIGFGIPLRGDEWMLYSIFDYYNITKFSGFFSERGRHIGGMLAMFPMRPFGRILIGFGVDALLSAKIIHSVLHIVYILGQWFAITSLIWIFNKNKNFKLIFLFTSLFAFYVFVSLANIVGGWHTDIAAYWATAALSITTWLPLAYFWIYGKEIKFFSNNKIMACTLWTFILYAGTFVHEGASLPVTGLSVFMLLYFIMQNRCKNFIKDGDNVRLPFSIIYLLITHIIFMVIAFTLTMRSGRGMRQLFILGDNTNIFSNIFKYLYLPRTDRFILIVIILSFIYTAYLTLKTIKQKQITRTDYISIALSTIGFLGMLGFSAIAAPKYQLCLVFIFISILLPILDGLNRNTFWANIMIPVVVVLMSFEFLILYDTGKNSYFLKNINSKSDRFIVDMFIEADRKKQTEIVISEKHTKNYMLEYQSISKDILHYPNRDISTWMLKYGYTKEWIGIRVGE